MRRSWGGRALPPIRWLAAAPLVLLGLYIACMVVGIHEWNYNRIASGMTSQAVVRILHAPTSKEVRSPARPELGFGVGPRIPPRESQRLREEAEAVWVWRSWLWIDQTIGVVFDGSDRVIYKWVDY